MIEREINEIGEADFISLKENSISEGKTIEYKQILPSDNDKDKIKFLAGISSFANAIGGDYIIGIVENNGVPVDIKGVDIDDIDNEKLRLEQIIRNGISPSIPSIIIRDIKLANNKIIFLIRIPQSWISPHRVVLRNHDKFYSRNSAGKYPLDVDELRMAFTLSETIEKKIKNFRLERISNILSNNTPVELINNPKVILHLIPLSSFSRTQNIDLNLISSDPIGTLNPIYGRASEWRYNFDGYLTYGRSNGDYRSYVQLYRNGVIEAVGADLIRPDGERKKILAETVENELIKSVERYLNTLKSLRINPPIFIFLTLLNIKGYILESRNLQFWELRDPVYEIDKNILMLSDIMINSFNVDVHLTMKPAFDQIWNAGGYERSLNYDNDGKRQ